MRRVMIIGCAGSGKSTLAKRLGSKTGLPVIHIDPFYWSEGWTRRPAPETRALVANAAAKPKWIFEGNNASTFPARAAVADTVVFLDFPIPLCLFRVLKRLTTGYGKSRDDMAPGCPERFDWAFLKWVCGYRRNSRPRALEMIDDLSPDVAVYHLKTRRAVETFLASVD